jgi:rhodanese-related sulfurtransferase
MESFVKQIGVVVLGALILVLALLPLSVSAAEFQQVKPEELKKMIENGKKDFLIVDAQPQGVYKTGHVKGAINFPWAPEIGNPKNLPKDKLFIIYCDCAHEEDATDTATQLMEKWGYTNLKLLAGGWSKWQELGYPVEQK